MATRKSSPSRSSVPRIELPNTLNALPSAGQSWGNYWTIITAMALVMFIVFIAANGQLTAWLNLFVFSTPQTVQPGSNASLAPSGSSNALGTSGQSQSLYQSFLGLFGYTSTNTPPQGYSPTTPASGGSTTTGGNTSSATTPASGGSTTTGGST